MPLPATACPQAFVLTADRARALPFYRDVLGLALLGEDDWGATFALGGGATLRLTDHAGWQPSPHTVIGWVVPDLDTALTALEGAGVRGKVYEGFGQDARGIWSGPGARIVWFSDAEGNVLSLTELSG